MEQIKALIKQWLGLMMAGIAAACCLGVPVILATVTTVGLGYLIRDAYLFPIFVGFVAVSLRVLFNSSRNHGKLLPFWVGFTGGMLGMVSLWFLVTDIYPIPLLVYGGLILLFIGSVWDFINGKFTACTTDVVCEVPFDSQKPRITGRHVAKGVTLSISAAALFYGMYESVEKLGPKSRASQTDIACWGINSCKGQTACSTAFNSCTRQNNCKGRGYLFVSEKECFQKGGKPLEKSEGALIRKTKYELPTAHS